MTLKTQFTLGDVTPDSIGENPQWRYIHMVTPRPNRDPARQTIVLPEKDAYLLFGAAELVDKVG